MKSTVSRGEGFGFQYYLVEEGIDPVTFTILYYKIKGDTTTTASTYAVNLPILLLRFCNICLKIKCC